MDIKKTFGLKLDKLVLPDKKIEEAEVLYPGQGRGEIRRKIKKELYRYLTIIAFLSLLLLVAMLVKEKEKKEEGLFIFRNSLNEGSSNEGLILSVGEDSVQYNLIVGSIELKDEEIDRLQEKAEEALDRYILAENADFYTIATDLKLPEEIHLEGYTLPLAWSSDRVDIVDTKGNVKADEVDKSTTVTIQAKVSYGNEFRVYEKVLTVIPRELSEVEKQLKAAQTVLEDIESDRSTATFELPEEIDGVRIEKSGKKTNYLAAGVLLAMLLPVVAYYSFFEGISEKKKRRVEEGVADYKEFISKLNLLLSAGMSVRLAWKKICGDYSGKKTLLAEVLMVSLRELDSGIREDICYQRFGERMGSRTYERLAEILSQQSSKGVAHVSQVLERELWEVCDSEKEQIRLKAEKASTILLLPIMGLLAIVFLVIMLPAFSGLYV